MCERACVCVPACSTEPLTHAHFPAVGVCVPAVTHCVSQHPSDICRLLSHPAPLSLCPDDITSAAAREVNHTGRETVMISHTARVLLHFSTAETNADEAVALALTRLLVKSSINLWKEPELVQAVSFPPLVSLGKYWLGNNHQEVRRSMRLNCSGWCKKPWHLSGRASPACGEGHLAWHCGYYTKTSGNKEVRGDHMSCHDHETRIADFERRLYLSCHYNSKLSCENLKLYLQTSTFHNKNSLVVSIVKTLFRKSSGFLNPCRNSFIWKFITKYGDTFFFLLENRINHC